MDDPVLGDRERLAEMRSNGAKGNLMTSRIWYVRDRFGDDALAKLVAHVPAAPLRLVLVRRHDRRRRRHRGGVRIVQTGTTLPYYFCAYGVCGWFEAAIELSGGKNIRVEHSACRHRGAENCAWDAHRG